MFNFGIAGYEPRWTNSPRAAEAAHGHRLRALTGRPLTGFWLAWDVRDDEWFADCPVLLDFGGEQVEINHWKFDDLSITWNTIDPQQPVDWPGFALRRHVNALPEPRALLGLPLQDVELLTWSGDDAAHGSIEVGFAFSEGGIAVHNALDENGLSFDPPDALSRPVTRRAAP